MTEIPGSPIKQFWLSLEPLPQLLLIDVQDAHEFLNYLLNQVCEILKDEDKRRQGGAPLPLGTPPPTTWVHEIFQGKLVNETRCLQVRDKREGGGGGRVSVLKSGTEGGRRGGVSA